MIDDLLNKEAALPLLDAHLSAMRECVELGWKEWRTNLKQSPSLAKSRKSTRANIVYDHVSGFLEEYFDTAEIPNSRKRGFLTASLGDGRIEVRVKKFKSRRKLTSSGIPTSQRLSIENQQVTLNGVSVTCLTIGYYPDELGIDLDVVALACTFGNTLLWSVDLLTDGGVMATPLHEANELDGPAVRSTRPAASKGELEVN